MRYMKKLFWNNKRTVCSRLVILSYFASCILSSKQRVCLHYFLTFELFWWSLLKLPTSHRRLRTSHRRVTDDCRRVTDQSQTTKDESLTTTDESQTTTDESQINSGEPQTITANKNHRGDFQPLTWFNKFICRPSDIYYYAIWFIYETY